MTFPVYKYHKPGLLMPGRVRPEYFNSLVEVCAINNPNMVQALAQVLVYGESRKDACVRNGVTMSYFSVKIRHMQRVCALIEDMYHNSPWVEKATVCNCSCQAEIMEE